MPEQPKAVRVAAYARVSSDKDTMLHSLSAQVSQYSAMIQNHPGWIYCGVYADEGISGTKEIRENFQRLLQDCRDGKIDLVLTKSISRFARNTVTLLNAVRELRQLGVDVFFEEQNIHTMSGDGELMLSILAGFAEEEARSVSENMKWRVQKNFKEGKPWSGMIYGYKYSDGMFHVVPEEAAVVKRIFEMYLSGMGPTKISNILTEEHVPQREYWSWSRTRIFKMLRNVTYTGDLLLQKTYRPDYITKRYVENHGEKDMYYVDGAHDAIIDKDTFEAVQAEIKRREKRHDNPGTSLFTGKIVCGVCGKTYVHKIRPTVNSWVCITYNYEGKKHCASKQIPENILIGLTAEVVGSLEELDDKISCIRAENGNRIIFCFKDGTEVCRTWRDRSRAESWTPEMREAARQRALMRKEKNNAKNSNGYPGDIQSGHPAAECGSGKKADCRIRSCIN